MSIHCRFFGDNFKVKSEYIDYIVVNNIGECVAELATGIILIT